MSIFQNELVIHLLNVSLNSFRQNKLEKLASSLLSISRGGKFVCYHLYVHIEYLFAALMRDHSCVD